MKYRERERERERVSQVLIGKPYVEIHLYGALRLQSASTRLAQGRLKTSKSCTYRLLSTSQHTAFWPSNVNAPSGVTASVSPALLSALFHSVNWLLGFENFRRYIFIGRLRTRPTQFMWHFRCALFTLRHSWTSRFEVHEPTRHVKRSISNKLTISVRVALL